MSPLPVEQTGESAGVDSQRSVPTPFLTKTYQIVEDSSMDDLISWNDDGTTFIVWRPAEFARDLLPRYFKHNNFSSFVRQLNTYGFRKVVPDRWEFSNECFRRCDIGLLRDITRRKISMGAANAATVLAAPLAVTVTVPVSVPVALPLTVAVPLPAAAVVSVSTSISGEEQVLSSNSSPADTVAGVVNHGASNGEVREENVRLRLENVHLNQELTRLRSLCSNICNLMTNYGDQQENSGGTGTGTGAGGSSSAEKALDLMPARTASAGSDGAAVSGVGAVTENEICPRLFGVSIGMKRVRTITVSDDDEEVEDENQGLQKYAQEGMGERSEPSDEGSNQMMHQESRWVDRL